jgi:hypothetical protein
VDILPTLGENLLFASRAPEPVLDNGATSQFYGK